VDFRPRRAPARSRAPANIQALLYEKAMLKDGSDGGALATPGRRSGDEAS
jgi:hypothetical protein